MANCSPCPVETPGKQFFLPRSSAAVPNTFVTSGTSPGVSKQGKDECWCSQCPLARTLQRRQHPCSPFCRGGSVFQPGALCFISSLWMVSWHLGEGRVGRGWDTAPRCPTHRYPAHRCCWCTSTPALRHRDPSTALHLHMGAPALRYPNIPLHLPTGTLPHSTRQSSTLTLQYTTMNPGTQHMAVLEQGYPKTQPLALISPLPRHMPCVSLAWPHRGLCCSLQQVRLVQFLLLQISLTLTFKNS